MSLGSFRVSVVVPTLNGAPFLRDAVESIRGQDPAPIEILVVDGGSTDGTDHVAQELIEEGGACEVRFVPQQPTQGLGGARNTGVRLARGNVVAFLDVDDLWSADKTALQLEHLAAGPEVQIVLGRTHKMRCTGTQDGRRAFENWAEAELALSMGAGLFRREVFDEVGAFDESRPFACDWDWFMRAREGGVRMLTHPETVQYYRRHELNMTLHEEEGNRDTLQMLKTSLLRRRAAAKGAASSLPAIPSVEASAPSSGQPRKN